MQALAKIHEVRMILRDVKAAFDEVCHTGLRVKRIRTRFSPRILGISSSFLDDRAESVRLGTVITPPFDINAAYHKEKFLHKNSNDGIYYLNINVKVARFTTL